MPMESMEATEDKSAATVEMGISRQKSIRWATAAKDIAG